MFEDSLVDPHGYLNSWDFGNKTEGAICMFLGVECWHPDENRVLNLRLSDMGLKGQFPRGLQYCTSLSGLDLSSNSLQGRIPYNLSKILQFVTSLDLSSNSFSGQIPAGIANCTYLNSLRLDHNQLTGHIPGQIGHLTRLKTFSVANNLLSGPVPNLTVYATVTAADYANNPGLCGGPLPRCPKHSRKFVLEDNYSFTSGFFTGFLVCSVSTIVVFISYCVPWVRAGKGDKMITIGAMIGLMIKGKNKKSEIPQARTLPMQEQPREGASEIVTRMSFKDLTDATSNFSQHNIIGLGQTGSMYKATLPNGWFLAIKRLTDTQHFEAQFSSELKTLGKLRHYNLLPLLGFCTSSEERLLAYKYMPNGNLHNWLHSGKGDRQTLQWPLRVKIAVGIARGLAWLHHGRNSPVAHLNITSKCVLLDQNFVPKLSNFGRVMLPNEDIINLSSSFSSSSEFWEWGFLKRDVFNYGMVLLELITGKEPTVSSSFDGRLAKWISDVTNSSSCLHDVIDKNLVGNEHEDEIFYLLKVVRSCVHHLAEQRPTMVDVLETIRPLGVKHGLEDVPFDGALRRRTQIHVHGEIAENLSPNPGNNLLVNDILCLKSIKDSLEDPQGYLDSTWNFNNTSEGSICWFAGVGCWIEYENRVISIRLSNMGLKGQFPQGLGYCASIQEVDLSSNEIEGPIPYNLSKNLPFVTTLDLSSNSFSGQIPPSIADFVFLNTLKLDHNKFTGQIPPEIGQLRRLKTFSVANNLLSGTVPNLPDATVSRADYANNAGLCGGPLKSCSKKLRRASHWFPVMFCFNSGCVPILLCALGTSGKQGSNDSSDDEGKEQEIRGSSSTMSFKDLSDATSNFSQHNIIGLGQTGTMYKATLPNGWFLAIKLLTDPEHFEAQFLSELTLGKLKHHNLLPLLGFCTTPDERLLVYKYMPKGNLYNWLHSGEDALDWSLRVKIAVGIARGLAWLHHGRNSPVAHLNITSKCVLLDQNFVPKLSNFGRAMLPNEDIINLSRSFSSSSEFWDWGFLKRDVFNYGMVLLELITGKEPQFSSRFDGSLAKWISEVNNSSCLHDAIERSLVGKGHEDEVFYLLKVARNCVHHLAAERPTMFDVLKTIRTLGEKHGLENVPFEFVQTGIGAPRRHTEIHVHGEITEVP
ncbi:hypothetical protein Tsubulata_035840 [Turnera subulata]|uniref:Protein kinase domain-containing protein n=1 Tax=Turnera subulata TaxID=218843 RepID=A0A9Q0JPD5_9ROSI|nr:hypothetical protein Tsubulata_035840 [Turnera subulata]